MKTYFYYSVNDFNEGFICEAINKKQMKSAQMNMKLGWGKEQQRTKVVNYFKSHGVALKNETNVTQFKY